MLFDAVKDFIRRLFRTETLIAITVVLSALAGSAGFPAEHWLGKVLLCSLAVLTALGYGVSRVIRKNKKDALPVKPPE